MLNVTPYDEGRILGSNREIHINIQYIIIFKLYILYVHVYRDQLTQQQPNTTGIIHQFTKQAESIMLQNSARRTNKLI